MRTNWLFNRQVGKWATRVESLAEDEQMNPQKHEQHEQIEAALCDVIRADMPLGRMPLNRWALVSLWALRFYVLVMLLLVVFKFIQSAGVLP